MKVKNKEKNEVKIGGPVKFPFLSPQQAFVFDVATLAHVTAPEYPEGCHWSIYFIIVCFGFVFAVRCKWDVKGEG